MLEDTEHGAVLFVLKSIVANCSLVPNNNNNNNGIPTVLLSKNAVFY